MLEEAITKTLAYRDIFDYPLTAEEVWQFLVEEKATKKRVERALTAMVAKGLIGGREEFYFLPGRETIVPLRRRRETVSKGKLAKARKRAAWLRLIPWVRAVFATGAVAVGNADEAADLDILIVTSPGRLWLARFLVFSVLLLLGAKRKAKSPIGKDKICPNMFFVSSSLALPRNERNLYTAHEAVQAKLLWERGSIHRQFLAENNWIGKFLPNWEPQLRGLEAWKCEGGRGEKEVGKKAVSLAFPPLNFLEKAAYELQLKYMARRRTTEVVSPERILFHAKDLPAIILAAYRARLDEQQRAALPL